ncbi:hypothetical protein LMG28614_05531 [Paraburkholderia ultramafica]|uniref:PAAR domain-containing protein n=1 Tax=Paraburkholderia ultramafica TaxID=1544867 RepID=A0A6S7BKI7_9BURK|nr:PAAR domain-containing protein [Paraburkholderia ultramafica]CAB3802038.1 hypothetical protein LMG28614_05531 [Paraburkholderia ultramafica]
MPGTYYAAVEGDPLDNGSGGYVLNGSSTFLIADETGRNRRAAFIGHQAWCGVCKSVGLITKGVPVRKGGRMIDLTGGMQDQAVGGDFVICNCADHPRIIAVYGRSWIIHDRGNAESSRADVTPTQRLKYDEQFTLTDAAGNALSNTYYTVRMPSGELVHGVTDPSGKTARYETDDAHRLALYIGHREA